MFDEILRLKRGETGQEEEQRGEEKSFSYVAGDVKWGERREKLCIGCKPNARSQRNSRCDLDNEGCFVGEIIHRKQKWCTCRRDRG